MEQQLWIERPLRHRSGKMRWTDVDNEWLREHYGSSTAQELQARFPDPSYHAIRKQAETLGLKRPQQGVPKPKGTSWSAGENAVLHAYAAGEMSYAELCVQLPGRSPDAIASQGRVLGVRFGSKTAYCRVVTDARDIIDKEDPLRMGW